MPFILRGVTLAGIDSVMRPTADRVEAWDRLANILDASVFGDIAKEITLEETIDTAEQLIQGKVRGRVVVNITN